MKKTLIFLLSLLSLLFCEKQVHGQSDKNNGDLWNIALSNDFVFGLNPCNSIKVEAYGFFDKRWKREAKDSAKARGKKTYLHFNLGFFNALRYNLYLDGVDGSSEPMGRFAWSVMSTKLFLCFVKHPRIMTNFNLSFDLITSNSNFGVSYSQYFYYYVFRRCAIGLGVGGYVLFQSNHSQLYWEDGYPYASVQFLFDI
jgi:hypothetical protein